LSIFDSSDIVSKMKSLSVLLVNPWICDFAAYDLWAQPLGLLQLGSLLREAGCRVSFIDCLNRHDEHPNHDHKIYAGKPGRCGTGKYSKMPLPTPAILADIPRRYYRYGIHPDSLQSQLESVEPPDLICTTCSMTYWYTGLQQTIRTIRKVFDSTPIWLGGTYARLCSEHAKQHSGADEIITDPLASIPAKLEHDFGFQPGNEAAWKNLSNHPFPAIDLAPNPSYAPILTSRGCPYQCPYCASAKLQPEQENRSWQSIYDEIIHWHFEFGITDFAFYDDALLINTENTLKPALEKICLDGLKLRFHTPNALHVRALTREWCKLLFESGFETLRLGLETTRPDKQKKWGGKVRQDMFEEAIDNLHQAGLPRSKIGVYLLCGLPGQTPEEVAEAIKLVKDCGAQPQLSEYSPIPDTAMWSEAISSSAFDLENEPLTHNNSFFACRRDDFSWRDLENLKTYARNLRRS
jgi:radical SAM superfamily enzyme YgiQ (UPF0313 family)